MPRKLNQDALPRDKVLVLYQRLTASNGKLFQDDIARDLGCSAQTVVRLIETIERHLGKDVFIERGLDGRRRTYRLSSQTEAATFGFSFEELRALALYRDLAAPFLDKDVIERISRSLTALALHVGDSATCTVSGAPLAFHSKGFIDYASHAETIAILNQAIAKQQVCTVVYRANGRQEASPYRYAPGRILAMNGTLYVLGYRMADESLLKERPTMFSLHRIAEVSTTGEFFRFDAADTASKSFGLPWHAPKRVRVRVAFQAADYVRDRVWSADQEIENQDDGGIILHVTTTSEKELQAWVLGFGELAEIVKKDDGAS